MNMNDGGPAFPRSPHTGDPSDDGMTLRDWFAGQALAGVMSTAEGLGRVEAAARSELLETATLIYEMADAMLKAREAKS